MATFLAIDGATAAVAAALTTCLLSFNWGMYRFFTLPHGSNSGIDTIKLLGTCFGVGSLAALLIIGAPSAPAAAVALLLATGGLALFWWAIRSNRRQPLSFAFSDDLPQHLVCDGPYRYVRHPFYTAYLLAWLVVPVATLEPLLLVPMMVMTIIYTAAARLEERKFASSRLAREYAAYRRVTGMFWPCLPGHRPPCDCAP